MTKQTLSFDELLKELLIVLTGKEKEVITKRFSLHNTRKQTLEQIGNSFSITRERVRQIEKGALNKLQRSLARSKLLFISETAEKILKQHGGILLEEILIAELLNQFNLDGDTDTSTIMLTLTISPTLKKGEKTYLHRVYWALENVSTTIIERVLQEGYSLLKKSNEVLSEEKISSSVFKKLQPEFKNLTPAFVFSALQIDQRIKYIPSEGFGLMMWRMVNPKSIRDKALIVLKKSEKPLHFVEIANAITAAAFDRKVVTVQAVHNELIRDEQFVLIGRGLYALKEWGYKKGTVADIIADLLLKKSPLTKKEIIDGVLKQRQVKKGTISLNLQKNPHFVRVGRAVYEYKA